MQNPIEEIVVELSEENEKLKDELRKRKNDYEELLQKKQKTEEDLKAMSQKLATVSQGYITMKKNYENVLSQKANMESTSKEQAKYLSSLQNKVQELQGKLQAQLSNAPPSQDAKKLLLACLEQLESIPELKDNEYLDLFKKMVENSSFSQDSFNKMVKMINNIDVLRLLVNNGLELTPYNMPDIIPQGVISNSLEFAVMIGDPVLTETIMEQKKHQIIQQALYLAIIKKRMPIINTLINKSCTNGNHRPPYSGFELIKKIIIGLKDDELKKTAIKTLLDIDKFSLKDEEYNELTRNFANPELVSIMQSSRFFQFRYQKNFTESLLNLSSDDNNEKPRPSF